jgi:hypothetical protein
MSDSLVVKQDCTRCVDLEAGYARLKVLAHAVVMEQASKGDLSHASIVLGQHLGMTMREFTGLPDSAG